MHSRVDVLHAAEPHTEKREFPRGSVGEDPASLLLWLRFDPWPGNFHMLQMQPLKKKKNQQQKT